jgi:hypothetical protein
MRRSVVAPAKRSPGAELKARTRQTPDGLPVYSFQTLLADLATIVQDTIQPNLPGAGSFVKNTLPSPVQQQALDLLGVRLRHVPYAVASSENTCGPQCLQQVTAYPQKELRPKANRAVLPDATLSETEYRGGGEKPWPSFDPNWMRG